jgi:3-hydroxyacyl-CoA dehydrogenase
MDMNHVAVLGPGRIGRQIALAFALGGCRVSLVDLKDRPAGEASAVFADARREIARDLRLMAEEGELGTKTGRGFFDYSGDRREAFETAKVRALLRQLRRQRDA